MDEPLSSQNQHLDSTAPAQPDSQSSEATTSLQEPTEAPIDIKAEETSFFRHLCNRLLTGVAVAVPLIATVLVLEVAYNFINGVTAPFYRALKITVPGLGFVTTLFILTLLGFMTTHVLGSRVLSALEAFIRRIPLVAQIYSVVKQALESFKTIKSTENFKRVAYVECPSTGCMLVGYVTGQIFEPKLGGAMTMVFVPHSPNPLTGFLIIVENHKVIESTLTLEQVTKLIMSAGLVAPVYSEV